MATIYYSDTVYSNLCTGQLVRMDKVERCEGNNLFNDAIGEWPNYIRLVLPILYISIDKKRKSRSPVVHSTNPVQGLYIHIHKVA